VDRVKDPRFEPKEIEAATRIESPIAEVWADV